MPSVLSIGSSQPLLQLERFSCRDVFAPLSFDHLLIIGMQSASPTAAAEIILWQAGIVPPVLVAEIHESVGPISGDQRGNRVSDQPNLLFGCSSPCCGLAVFGVFDAQPVVLLLQFPDHHLLAIA